jgi:hypothetical protein
MLKPATVMSNDCDMLTAQGLLTMTGDSSTTSGARLPDRTPCRDVPPNQHALYPNCISFDPADHCSELPVYGGWLPGQTDLSAVCNARKTNAMIEREQAFQQRQAAAVPAVAPGPVPPGDNTPPADSLIADGSQLCRLKPELMAGLREEAWRFVRVDAQNSQIIMSEGSGSARREIALDSQAFANRAMSAAADIGGGGVKCGMAFWNSEAIKAASTALSSPP